MSETKVAYQVAPQPHARVPERWLRFLFRMAQLERGRVYNITVIIPDKPESEPQWSIAGAAKLENGG